MFFGIYGMMLVWGKRPESQYPIIMDALQYIKG
jgi:hypothetical protein